MGNSTKKKVESICKHIEPFVDSTPDNTTVRHSLTDDYLDVIPGGTGTPFKCICRILLVFEQANSSKLIVRHVGKEEDILVDMFAKPWSDYIGNRVSIEAAWDSSKPNEISSRIVKLLWCIPEGNHMKLHIKNEGEIGEIIADGNEGMWENYRDKTVRLVGTLKEASAESIHISVYEVSTIEKQHDTWDEAKNSGIMEYDGCMSIVCAQKNDRCSTITIRNEDGMTDIETDKPYTFWKRFEGKLVWIRGYMEYYDHGEKTRILVLSVLGMDISDNSSESEIRHFTQEQRIAKSIHLEGPKFVGKVRGALNVDLKEEIEDEGIRLQRKRTEDMSDTVEDWLIRHKKRLPYVRETDNETNEHADIEELPFICAKCTDDLEKKQMIPQRKKVFSLPALKELYQKKKKDIPENVREEIERCFESTNSVGSHSEKENAKKVLYYLLNFEWTIENTKIDIQRVMNWLNTTHVGMNDLKDMFRREMLAYNYSSDRNPETILLVGKNGCGKTSIAKALFEGMKKPYELLCVAGLNDPNLILGSGRMYENGQPSELTRLYLRHSRDAGFIIDQIDKADGLCKNALQSFLDRGFMDSFLEVELDLSKLWIICTASDTKDIDPSLLRKMKIFYVDECSEAEKGKIVSRILIPRMCEKFNLSWNGETFPKNVIDRILQEYAVSSPVSEIENVVKDIFVSALEKGDGFPKITDENFEEYHNWSVSEKSARDMYATTISEFKRKINACASLYPESMLKKNRELIDMVEYGNNADKDYALNVLKITANILKTKNPEINIIRLRDELNNSHYGMSKVKNAILRHVYSSKLSNSEKTRAILLNGSAGVGKTSIGMAIAKALNRRFVKIALNGISGSEALKGYGRTYRDAQAGLIVSSLAKPDVCSYSPVMLIDELDKVSGWNHGNPYAAFMDLLDGQGGFYDAYIDEYIPTNDILFVFTSNDISKIPAPVLDRMEVIDIPGYTVSEKRMIAKQYIIPKMRDIYHLSDLHIDDLLVDRIVNDYCHGNGVRDVERTLSKLIEEKAKDNALKKQDVMIIEEVDLKKTLGAKQYNDSDISELSNVPFGIVRALAVQGNSGSSFGIQIVENRFGKKDFEITGLAKGSFAESIRVARTLVSNLTGKKLPPIHIHALSPGVQKDGPSAGVTIFTCMMSFILKQPVGNIAMTGTIDLFGNIGVIGGEKLKIMAAERAKVKTVYLPTENYERLRDDGDLDLFSDLEIVPVSHVKELLNMLFSGNTESNILYFESRSK